MNFVNVHGRIGLESSIIWERWRWGRNRGLAVGRRKAFPSVAARKLRQFPRRVEAQLASQWRTMHCLLDDLFSIPLFPPVSDYRDGRFPVVIVSDDLFPGGEASGSPSLCTLAVTTVFAPLGTFHARRVIQTLVLECSGPAKACSPLSSFPFPLSPSSLTTIWFFISSRVTVWVLLNARIVLDFAAILFYPSVFPFLSLFLSLSVLFSFILDSLLKGIVNQIPNCIDDGRGL